MKSHDRLAVSLVTLLLSIGVANVQGQGWLRTQPTTTPTSRPKPTRAILPTRPPKVIAAKVVRDLWPGLRMMPIPAGSFSMGKLRRVGTEGAHTWKPEHEVVIAENFWMAENEVTNAFYRGVLMNRKDNR